MSVQGNAKKPGKIQNVHKPSVYAAFGDFIKNIVLSLLDNTPVRLPDSAKRQADRCGDARFNRRPDLWLRYIR